ncbi:MAG: UDP-3-O-(3-hydroxymyristoyl)glucosamine N-acyltransferase [Bacteroidaceae bacterium]|nr:UDP-3-O-(3-hydroxymyristoyl)glucosamine N-acyltransferase [Bacteroidaceae bacterium]MBP3833101.1 UDP-3-O-(3-hydroxymyristoyl)glucosamine N-acyltransferase [Bacteroidaceae bacterium]MBQ9676365.1 UDP-3-O-(3-hydroxymyristoyl)glucosamine N-acyltransferase [Bacteroidaceae bacterium]
MDFSAQQIASFVQGEIVGDANVTVNTFAKIEEGKPGSITFLSNPKYEHFIYDTDASIVLVNRNFVPEKPIKATLIKVDNAYETLAKLMTLYEQSKTQSKGISSTAIISESAIIGKDVYIGAYVVIDDGVVIGDYTQIYPHTYVGKNARIGEGSLIYSGVNIYHDCQIGSHVILHSGVVIGADGFGFAPAPEGYNKIPQIGNVIIEDNVEIGANSCVDRATMGSTIVHKGVKLDNLIQIAHNDEIGANTVMAAQAGVAGSAKVGEWCVIAGQVGITGHLTVGNHVILGPQSGIISSIKDNSRLIGSPPMEEKPFFKSQAVLRKLPDMYRELNALRKELDELKKNK